MPKHLLVVSTAVSVWLALAAGCFAGFSENPPLPRLRPVTNGEWSEQYAMTSTANPGTFVVTVENTDEWRTFDCDVAPDRWQDIVNIRAYCYETNTETSLTLTTWKQGPNRTVLSGGFPPDYYWTQHMGGWPYPPEDDDCHPVLSYSAYSHEFMDVVKVDITKDALPPAPGQMYGKLYATVNLAVTSAGGPWPENMIWAFEISRNASGQPTITPVRCPSGTTGWTPSICDNEYFGCQGAGTPTIATGTYGYFSNEYPGLIRHTIGAGCNMQTDGIISHCVTINKRPGATPAYEAWVWWYQARTAYDEQSPFHKKRIFGYRLDSATEQWTVLRATASRPDPTEARYDMAAMDGCLDAVGGKIWFQIGEYDGGFNTWDSGVITASWIPTNFTTQSTESAFYNSSFSDYNDAVAQTVEDVVLGSGLAALCTGSIDSTWHTGTQGQVFGTYSYGSVLKAYRITGTTLTMDPNVLEEWTNSTGTPGLLASETPDVTWFGNPNLTSLYGRSGTTYYTNPHGAAIATNNYANVDTSLLENSETGITTLKRVTKEIPLSRNDGLHFSQVDLTKDNHWVKVSQVKKRLDQSAAYQTRDRELFYTWMGVDAQDQKVLVIKRSASQAFRFGLNYQTCGFQWVGNQYEHAGQGPYFFGGATWASANYARGALMEFVDTSLAGFHSGDQIFNAVLEEYVGVGYDGRNRRSVAGNELTYSWAYAGLVADPTDFEDSSCDTLYPFVSPGQNGWQSVDVSESWNFFRERPWGYNYFHLTVPYGGDEGVCVNQPGRLWCYWMDWQ